MRMLVFLIVIVYLVGVGVVLSPTITSKWSSAPSSELASNVSEALPGALAWPATLYKRISAGG
jgi:hypothetical protein